MDDAVAVSLWRHGLTEKNKQHAYCGWLDEPLAEEGILRLKHRPKEKPDLLYASDLKRCIQTASFLYPETRPVLLTNLREMNFGDWEGKTYEELKHLANYQRWLDDPFSEVPPSGESMQAFSERVSKGWESIRYAVLAENAVSAAIVSHGGVIRCLLTLFSENKKAFWEWRLSPGAGYKLYFKKQPVFRLAAIEEIKLEQEE